MEDQAMFSQKNAKTMAKSLRDSLVDRNVSLSHSKCLEIVARQYGFADWNTLSAKLGVEENRVARPQGADTAPSRRSCSLCGKLQHEVRSLIEGNCPRPPVLGAE